MDGDTLGCFVLVGRLEGEGDGISVSVGMGEAVGMSVGLGEGAGDSVG